MRRSNQGDFQEEVALELSLKGCQLSKSEREEDFRQRRAWKLECAWPLRPNAAGVGEGCGKMKGKVGGEVSWSPGHADLKGHVSRFCLVLPAEESLKLGRGE